MLLHEQSGKGRIPWQTFVLLLAGDDTTQLAHEIHTWSLDERKKLIEEIRRAVGNFRISVEQSVVLKADLSIPWSKLRVIRR